MTTMAFTNNFSHLIFSFLVIFLLIISNNHSPALAADPQTQELIDKICRQLEDYGFCNKVFNQNLKIPSTNIEGLTQIALERTTENVTSVLAYAQSLLNDAATPEVKDILTECVKDYRTITNAFTLAFKAFGERNFKEMLVQESPAPKALGLCEGNISFEPGPPVNPFFELIEKNRQLRILIAMSLVSGHLLST